MNTSTKKKGPASVGALPSHGSTNPQKDMDMNKHVNTTAAAGTASETRDIGDAIDIVCRAISINELMFEAAHRMSDKGVRNAFVEGSVVVTDFLNDAKAILYASLEREGGEA